MVKNKKVVEAAQNLNKKLNRKIEQNNKILEIKYNKLSYNILKLSLITRDVTISFGLIFTSNQL